jgi:hypothetical protein
LSSSAVSRIQSAGVLRRDEAPVDALLPHLKVMSSRWWVSGLLGVGVVGVGQ